MIQDKTQSAENGQPFSRVASTGTPRLVLIAAALMWLAGCSFVPQQSSPPAVAETADVVAKSPADAAAAAESAAGATRVISVNPYTEGRKAVPAAAQKRFAAAIEGMRAADWLEAEQHLVWLNNEFPDYSGPFLNLGIVYRQQGKLADAEAAFGGAINANRKNLDAYNQLAILLREQGRFAEAEVTYQEALTVWPEHPETHRNLGILYDLYMGRLEQALVHYQQYQSVTAEPNRTITGWIVDLERRLDRLAAN